MYEGLMNDNIERDNSFTVIRLVCCFFIMYAHIVVISDLSVYFIDIRQEAVNIFFILSGFWVTHSLLRTSDLRKYFFKRIKKIVPLYYIVIILTSLIFVFFTELSPLEYFNSFHLKKYLISNFLFANFICNTLPGVTQVPAVNSSLWTLKIELGFYVILPIIIWAILKWKCKGKNEKVILLNLFVINWLFVFGINICVSKFSLPESFREQLPWYFPFFLAGMIFYFYFDEIMKKGAIIFPISLTIVVLFHFTQNNILYVIEPFCLATIVFVIGTRVTFLKKIEKKIKYDLSYPIYLLHCPILNILLCMGLFSYNWKLGIIVTIICTVVVAWMINKVLSSFIR